MSTMGPKEALSFLNQVRPDKPGLKDQPEQESDDNDSVTLADMEGGTLRPSNKNLTRIHFVLKNGTVRTLQYAHMDVQSVYAGGSFVLIFAGTRHWQVTVKGSGKEFWRAYDLVTLHRCPYIREATGSMLTDQALFTSVEFADITPEE